MYIRQRLCLRLQLLLMPGAMKLTWRKRKILIFIYLFQSYFSYLFLSNRCTTTLPCNICTKLTVTETSTVTETVAQTLFLQCPHLVTTVTVTVP